ncbi:MAG: hypothetical protein HKL79_00540 [Thermoplasmata archaeon]|jgi:hypothetical protein|nr:hypothetical protein [Thermoplasmata archaeon]
MTAPGDSEEARLLDELHRALAQAPAKPREIEVGIALSIALGRQRPSVSCGGCSTPLEFEGIPARTNAGMQAPFRLLFEPSTSS